MASKTMWGPPGAIQVDDKDTGMYLNKGYRFSKADYDDYAKSMAGKMQADALRAPVGAPPPSVNLEGTSYAKYDTTEHPDVEGAFFRDGQIVAYRMRESYSQAALHVVAPGVLAGTHQIIPPGAPASASLMVEGAASDAPAEAEPMDLSAADDADAEG